MSEARHARDEALRRTIVSLRFAGLRRALNSWVVAASQLSGVASLLSALMHRTSRMAFNTWVVATNASIKRCALLSRMLSALRHLGTRRAMNAWCEMVAEAAQTRHTAMALR